MHSPASCDQRRPRRARLLDAWLDGKDAHAADRALAARLTTLVPGLPAAVHANRDFTLRSVTALARAGIGQYLTIGCGYPHHVPITDLTRPHIDTPRIVVLHDDPVVLAHTRATSPGHIVVPGTLGDLADALDELDGAAPTAVVLTTALHAADDDQATAALGLLHDRLAPGSRLVLSQLTCPPEVSERIREAARLYQDAVETLHPRSPRHLTELLHPWRIEPPGPRPLDIGDAPGAVPILTGIAVLNR